MLTTLNNYNCNYYLIMYLGGVNKFSVSRKEYRNFKNWNKTKKSLLS